MREPFFAALERGSVEGGIAGRVQPGSPEGDELDGNKGGKLRVAEI